jgi:hypothetical protein
MIRKMLVIAAAVAMPVSVIAMTAGPAGAASTVNATNYTVSCTGITAKATFSPALTTLGSTPGVETTKIAGTASGCTVTPTLGGTAVHVKKATISGTITNPTSSHTCTGLETATTETGSLKVKWTTTPKLSTTTSVVKPTTVTGAVGADLHATFAIAFGTGATGPFQGSDGGISSTTNAETVLGGPAINAQCATTAGLTTLGIQPNSVTNGGGPAFTVG